MLRHSTPFVLLVIVLAAAIPLADLLFAQPPAKGKKVALLIGVNQYANRKLDPLNFAEADVTDLERVLKTAGFEVKTIRGSAGIDPQANRSGKDVYFAALADSLKGVGRSDTVLLGFSGHGVQLFVKEPGPDGKPVDKESPFFCPADGIPSDATTLIGINDVLKVLDERGGGHNLLLVDACRNVVDPNRGSRGGINGSRIDNLPEGTAVFFSCSGRQKARETEKAGGGHGVFFHFVLEGLKGAPGATDGKGRVTWDRLVPYVKEQVKEAGSDWLADLPAGERQVPFAIGSLGDVPPLVAGDLAKPADEKTYTSKATGMKFVRVKAGTFTMGSTPEQIKAVNEEIKKAGFSYTADDEGPTRQVTLTKDYFLGECEVTRGQFRKFVEAEGYKTEAEADGKGGYGWDTAKKTWVQDPKYTWRDPGFVQTDEHPVVEVSWNDAVAFCEWLSRKEGKTYRLPTEAEWEYACRAGSRGRFHFGDDDEELAKYGNVADASFRAATGMTYGIQADDRFGFTAPVRQFKPNPWGLYDMHGNAWEWCQDYYGPYDKLASLKDSFQSTKQSNECRVLRGGSWVGFAGGCRAAYRSNNAPDYRSGYSGFRVCFRLD